MSASFQPFFSQKKKQIWIPCKNLRIGCHGNPHYDDFGTKKEHTLLYVCISPINAPRYIEGIKTIVYIKTQICFTDALLFNRNSIFCLWLLYTFPGFYGNLKLISYQIIQKRVLTHLHVNFIQLNVVPAHVWLLFRWNIQKICIFSG